MNTTKVDKVVGWPPFSLAIPPMGSYQHSTDPTVGEISKLRELGSRKLTLLKNNFSSSAPQPEWLQSHTSTVQQMPPRVGLNRINRVWFKLFKPQPHNTFRFYNQSNLTTVHHWNKKASSSFLPLVTTRQLYLFPRTSPGTHLTRGRDNLTWQSRIKLIW